MERYRLYAWILNIYGGYQPLPFGPHEKYHWSLQVYSHHWTKHQIWQGICVWGGEKKKCFHSVGRRRRSDRQSMGWTDRVRWLFSSQCHTILGRYAKTPLQSDTILRCLDRHELNFQFMRWTVLPTQRNHNHWLHSWYPLSPWWKKYRNGSHSPQRYPLWQQKRSRPPRLFRHDGRSCYTRVHENQR